MDSHLYSEITENLEKRVARNEIVRVQNLLIWGTDDIADTISKGVLGNIFFNDNFRGMVLSYKIPSFWG